MKQVGLMAAACVATWLVAVWLTDHHAETFFGMFGPLLAASVTWLAVARAHRANPAGVTTILMTAFAIKMVFFGAYVVVTTRLWTLDLVPFGVAFAAYFLALYGVQAVLVQGLARSPRVAAPH